MNVLFTAGTQFIFPRMARVIEAVADARPSWTLVYQAGPGAEGDALPHRVGVRVHPLFPVKEFKAIFEAAELVVTHAGMGNIITCLEASKSAIMMPRLVQCSEHRNDHQIATAESVNKIYNVPYFFDHQALIKAILNYEPAKTMSSDMWENIRAERSKFSENLNALVKKI